VSKKISIKSHELGTVTISAPTSSGKSILLYKISEMLKKEFDANVVSPDLELELKGNDYTNISDWQKDMIKGTVWYLQEYSERGE